MVNGNWEPQQRQGGGISGNEWGTRTAMRKGNQSWPFTDFCSKNTRLSLDLTSEMQRRLFLTDTVLES